MLMVCVMYMFDVSLSELLEGVKMFISVFIEYIFFGGKKVALSSVFIVEVCEMVVELIGVYIKDVYVVKL